MGSVLQALREVAHVKPGENVVVTGAGGGLGLHALQVVAALGARAIAVTSSAHKSDLLRANCADEVLISSKELAQEILDVTDGRGAEVVLDNVGHPDVFSACFRATAPQGRYVLTGQIESRKVSFHPAFVFGKEVAILGSNSTSMATFMRALDLVAEKKVRPVTQTFPLAEAAEVHTRMETGGITASRPDRAGGCSAPSDA